MTNYRCQIDYFSLCPLQASGDVKKNQTGKKIAEPEAATNGVVKTVWGDSGKTQ